MQADSTPPDTAIVQRILVNALQNPARYPYPVEKVTLLETHISYVLLTGRFAYKIKKAVNLGFLDFSSLEQRRFYCIEELRLNRRLAPGLYLSTIAIRGTPDDPHLGNEATPGEQSGSLECLEYAVKMLEFPQAALLDRRLSAGELLPAEIDALADRIAGFHAQAARTGPTDAYGTPALVWATMAHNLTGLRAETNTALDIALLDALETWSRDQHARLKNFMATRRSNGFVRECHGDLHLGNIAQWRGSPQIFDCIEFNPNLRWIDVISEIAFLTIDLEEKERPDYGHRFLNRYLEASGDYAGLPALSFYRVYRALVRAKVAGIRAAQGDRQTAQAQAAIRSQYLVCARRASLPRQAQLLLMHGVSGSGKSRVAQAVLERIGALRLRSDVERKRIRGLPALARSTSLADGGLYDAAMTRATYQRLVHLAQLILQAGLPVVVDAASLQRWQRRLFRSLADALNVPFRILSCRAAEPVLRQRLLAREHAADEASEAGIAVLLQQLRDSEALSVAEQSEVILFDSEHDSLDDILQRVEKMERRFDH